MSRRLDQMYYYWYFDTKTFKHKLYYLKINFIQNEFH